MYIKFNPPQKKELDGLTGYEGRTVATNLGDFAVGQVGGPYEGADGEEARRLVENGDGFEDVTEKEIPNSNAVAEGETRTSRRPVKKR